MQDCFMYKVDTMHKHIDEKNKSGSKHEKKWSALEGQIISEGDIYAEN